MWTCTPLVNGPVQSRLCDMVQDHSLHQLVQQETRGSDILELVLTNDPALVENVDVVENLDGCDHDAVQFDLALRTSRTYQPRRFVYNYKKADFDAFRDYMANIPWECTQMDDGIEENWQNWKDTFNAAVMECIPRVMWKPKKSKCWLNKETDYQNHQEKEGTLQEGKEVRWRSGLCKVQRCQ